MTAIGVIGCGKMAERHLRAMIGLNVADSYLLFDQAPVAAERLAQNYGLARVVNSVHEMLSSADVVGVLVLTPTPSHSDHVIQALDADKFVFCEKPLAMTECEVENIALAEQRAIERSPELRGGMRRLMVGYIYRHMPAMKSAREIIEKRVLGDLYSALLRLGGRGNAAQWKHIRSTGGGALREMAVHQLDTAQWLLGELTLDRVLEAGVLRSTRVVAKEAFMADAEDFVLLRVSAGGIPVLIQSDLTSPGFMQWVEIQGERGTLFASVLPHLPSYVELSAPSGDFTQGVTPLHFDTGASAHVGQMRMFGDLMQGGGSEAPGAAESLAIARVVDAVSESYVPPR